MLQLSFTGFLLRGVAFENMHGFFESRIGLQPAEVSRQVFSLAGLAIKPLIASGLPDDLSHVVVATTCPDMLAPSLGQMISEKFHETFGGCHSIDIVQGCAGGVTAMILGSQLCELNRSSVMVIQADAARKATSTSVDIHKIFGNGAFACVLRPDSKGRKMIHYKSKQYKGLSEVVTVGLGHDADKLIQDRQHNITQDPRKYLGLAMDNNLALKLVRKAEQFYLDFVHESVKPDVMILHQVNPVIMLHLKKVFSKYDVDFIDMNGTTGNCGAATVGIALNSIKDNISGKKIFLCSFGTGGVITAGLWQS